MKNIVQRTLTGILFIAVVITAICVHPFLFAGVFSLTTGLLIYEFYSLSKYEGAAWQRYLGIAGGMYLFFASCLFAGGYAGNVIYIPYILILLVLLVSGLYVRNGNPVTQWGLVCFAQVYCGGLLSLLCFIPYMRSPEYNPLPVLMIFVFIWLYDTGAYLVGSWKGKHRLFLSISPLKSWEGFFGGLVFVIITALVCSRLCSGMMSWYSWIAFAVIITVSATWGDLVESLFKRTFGVKDSGKFFPGHGGVFDRFDSAILASPAAYIFFEFVIRN